MYNILDLLKITDEEKDHGVWLSGIEREGEYKQWHRNGQLRIFSTWEKEELHGVFKRWYKDGDLAEYEIWENGKRVRTYIK